MKKRILILPLIVVLLVFIFIAVVFSTDTKIEIVYAENSYTSTPVITVLTHGLGGHPADWSNNGTFDYTSYKESPDQTIYHEYYSLGNEITGYHHEAYYAEKAFHYQDNSLIERLRQGNPNSVVYIVSANNTSENDGNPYIDIFTPDLSSPTGYSAESTDTIDITKHSIIVYNALNTWKTFVSYGGEGYNNDFGIDHLLTDDDTVVGDFFRTIDYIVDLFQNANGGIMPKMNLIGHSQGTIVNLLYATKYPDRIDSMLILEGAF